MSRIGAVRIWVGLLVLSICGAASGQGAGGGAPAMPMAVDLSKVAVGNWSEYNMTFGKIPPMKMRMALVAKGNDKTGHTIETVAEGGMASMAGGKMAMQTILTVGAGGEVKIQKMVMQMGANDPMEMPVEGVANQQFQKPDPKMFVKEETVKVAAGTFKAKRYRNKTAQGDTIEFWINDTIAPMGLVKMEGEQKSNPNVKGKVTVELIAMGKDAKATITKKPKPFDQQALMQQMMGAGHAKKPAPAAPAAAPAPAPAAPKSK